jgi:hypothetical protein
MATLLQAAKQYLAHQQRFQLLGNDTIHFAGTVFCGETFLQQ